MITLKNISKNFGNKIVLSGINLVISEKDKIVFVGENGSGKSTLLKIIAGLLEPDQGTIEISKNLKIVYFPQEIPKEEQKEKGEDFIAQNLHIEKDKIKGTLGNLLKQLDFSEEALKKKIEELSGGEKSKILLMLILKSSADIFLLDEPTNNLDLRGLILLEQFINNSQKGFCLVSHDRKLLERFAKNIVEIDDQNHNLKIYRGFKSFNQYLQEKRNEEMRKQENYEVYIKEKLRLEETVILKKQEALNMQKGPAKPRDNDKYIVGFKKDRSKKIASQATSIEKKIEQMGKVEKPRRPLPLNLKFYLAERSGDAVFRLNKLVFRSIGPIDLEISYGDRIVIIGPNGAGKTILLQIILGLIKAEQGLIQKGSNLKIGYLPQEIQFNEDRVIDYFLKETELNETNARRILARFGFFEEEIYSKIFEISPGQRSRLILATIMARPINCLILDEPSNHLDSETIDRLEEAIKDFNGTIIIVSHDRYFIDQVNVCRTILLEKGKIEEIKDYHEYEKRFI